MDAQYADRYALLEKTHWWFRARRRVLTALLAWVPWPASPRIAEIGIASGENLYEVFPDARLIGIEPEPHNAARARAKGPVPVYVATAEALPDVLQDGTCDGLALFDVLEHTPDDGLVLRHLRAKLKADGWLVLSVPAYRWLWGRQDDINRHYRRYTRGELVAKLRHAGYAVRRATYFNTLLFPPIATLRLLAKIRRPRARASNSDFDYATGRLDPLLFFIFRLEGFLLRRLNFPFGVSVFAAAQRASDPPTEPSAQ
jgi:SAM-dependent methyltransferase